MANHKAAKGKPATSPKKRTFTSEYDEDDVPAGKGHNRQKVTTGGVEVPKLKSYVERIERLEEDKAAVASDIKDVKAEAKSNGFDVKAINQIIKDRKLKANERAERDYVYDLYARALGMTVEELDETLD